MSAVGHVNATIGIAECLRDRGHRVVYVVDKSFAGKLKEYGFEEEILDDGSKENENMKPGEEGALMIKKTGILSAKGPLEQMKSMADNGIFEKTLEKKMQMEPQLKAVVDRVNPDIVIVDDFFGLPSLIHSNRPWVNLCSGNPLFYLPGDNLPAAGSGQYHDQFPIF